jgi:hypothetical protein
MINLIMFDGELEFPLPGKKPKYSSVTYPCKLITIKPLYNNVGPIINDLSIRTGDGNLINIKEADRRKPSISDRCNKLS